TPTSVSMLCVLSPCLYPHRPPSPTRRSSDLPVDPAEQEELPLAIHAAAHVAEQRWIVAIVEHVRQPPQRFLVGHGASSPSSVARSEEHTSELSHGSISYAVFCLKKKKISRQK